jgi:protein-disulfide isomerase/uncharacterized membrane protein
MISSLKTNSADNAVSILLDTIGINSDSNGIADALLRHPDFPSVLAVSDVLTSRQIENEAFKVTYEDLAEIPCPFLAHTFSNGGELLVVTHISEDGVYVAKDRWRKKKLSSEKFKDIFSGIILTVEGPPITEATAQKDALISFWKLLKPYVLILGFVVFFAISLFSTGYFTNLGWQLGALSVIKTAGLAVSVLLLVQSFSANVPFIQKLCQNQDGNGCNAILSSKAAKVFEGLSWSEVGFFYFAGTWLITLYGGNLAAKWQFLALLNVICLPYTFYSIYYQARVAKQWCVLCSSVQVILWLEFVVFLTRFQSGYSASPALWDWMTGAALAACLIMPVLLWLVIRPLILNLQQVKPLKGQLNKFKYNRDMFNAVVGQQPVHTSPAEDWSIVLGNPDATDVITVASNPYCQPCADMHKYLDELLDQNPNFQLRIIFTTENVDDDMRTGISRHFMALNALPDKNIVKAALNDWYLKKQTSEKSFTEMHPANVTEKEIQILEKQKEWYKMAEITATPTVLINGHRLPGLYHPADLTYMLN